MKNRFFKYDKDIKKYIIGDNIRFDKKRKVIDQTAITSLKYGIVTANLKLKETEFTRKKFRLQPWLFFSLVLKERTFDFFIENEEDINKTIFGFSMIKEINNLSNFKIMKRSDFLLHKFKLKLVINIQKYLMMNDKSNKIELIWLYTWSWTKVVLYAIKNRISIVP